MLADRRRGNLVITLVISLLIISFNTVKVYANRSEVDSISYVGENQTTVLAICSSANRLVGRDILVYTSHDGLLSFSNRVYSELDTKEKRDFMETALLATKESGLGNQVKNKVYNFISEQDSTISASVKYLVSDASADFATASAWFKPFGSVFGVLLGVLSLLIFMFIGLSTVIDIAYMVVPGVRVLLEGGVSGKPKFVSTEAYSAIKESEEGMRSNDYKGYMGIYFKRRLPSLFAMAIALGYLISGEIYSIIAYIIDAFSWML